MSEQDRIVRLEALLRVDERIAALEVARPPKGPLWKNAGLVAAYGAVLAIVPALFTGVTGWVDNEREIGLAAEQHEHERTLAYLGLAIDPEATEAGRHQVLRFLASLDGDPVGVWAASELKRVEQKLTELEAEKQRVTEEVAETSDRAREVHAEAASLFAETNAQEKPNPAMAKRAAAKGAEAEQLDAELERKRDRVDALSTRVGDTPLHILQLRAQHNAPDPAQPPERTAPRRLLPSEP